jgi:hypothetical protein
MSFWLYGKKRDGKRHVYSVNVPLQIIVVLFGLMTALLLPLIASCRTHP